ncbi:MAG: peptidoglycan editing factor PgeF [Bacteroidota bacterium]
MIRQQKGDIHFLQFHHFSRFPGLKHFVSTRKGGISPPPFDSLNTSLKNDQPDFVLENRKRLAQAVQISLEHFCFAQQCHGNQVSLVRQSDQGRGVYQYDQGIAQTDALITQSNNICLVVGSADCVPILLYAPKARVIAAIHSGWRGTVKKILSKTLELMITHHGAKPQEILAGIGPCIARNMYEIGEDVVKEVKNSFMDFENLLYLNSESNKYHLDLKAANLVQLQAHKIPLENIEISSYCTYEDSDLFFSYRRQKGKTGIFATGIMLDTSE